MSDNLKIWERVKQPPDWALKPITGGRLKGMTDISPQWRYEVMTELFGPCGQGWWYTIDKQWLEEGGKGEVAAFVNVTLYTEELEKGIPASGGSMFVADEKNGPHVSDEAYKMATTDALSVAMKVLGVAANIYYGKGARNDATKYSPDPPRERPKPKDRAKALKTFRKAWDELVGEAAGGDEPGINRKLESYFLWAKGHHSIGEFDEKQDYMRTLDADAIDKLTAILNGKKRDDVIAWLETDDVRSGVDLPLCSVVVCEICNAVLTDAEKFSCSVGKMDPHCTKHAPEGVKKAQKKKEASKDEA